jgi:serine/threonine protein kinase
MGVVYEAEDLKLGRHVALKLLPGAADPAMLERFWREARAASALNHPGICTLYEINESESQPFLVMELLEGRSLDQLFAGHAVPVKRLAELGVQIADALDAAHRKGILHRDIKPANIFVTTSGQTKILDFGLARFEDRGSPDTADTRLTDNHLLTTPGSTLGTIAYMSPEQARGEELDARSDVFSLGVVLYELGTGKHPFEGTTTAVVFDKLLNYLPPAPNSFNADLPSEFESIVCKALEKDRDLRYQSAADLRADLLRLQRNSSGSRTMASAVGVPTASSYPGMIRAGTSASMPAAHASSAAHPPATRGSGSTKASTAAIATALRTASASPLTALRMSATSAAIRAPRELLSRARFRRMLLALTVFVVIFSIWKTWSRMHRPPVPMAVPASASPATPPATTPAASTPAPSPDENATPAETSAPATAPVASAPAVRPEARKPGPKPSAGRTTISAPTPAAAQPAATPAAPVAATPAPSSHPLPSTTPAASAAKATAAPVSYSARHMHAFPFLGGRSCDGTLQLTSTSLIYTSSVHPVTLTRDKVASIEGNGVVETGGKKWRFEITGMTNAQVHDLLAKWYQAGAH